MLGYLYKMSTDELSCKHVRWYYDIRHVINNEGFDALAQGLSARERGVWLCETVLTVNMMYVNHVA